MWGKRKYVGVRTACCGRLLFPRNDKVMLPALQATGHWEPEEAAWLKKNLRSGMNALNVGANVGLFSILMSDYVGQSGHVIAVEPNPELIPALRRNCRRVRRSISVVEAACSDRPGRGKLYLNRTNFGDSRVFDPSKTKFSRSHLTYGFEEQIPSVKVEIISVDGLLRGGRLDLALIDAQGWDHHVIRGMKETIALWHPRVLVEFVPSWIRDLDEDPLEILREWQDLGYEVGIPSASSSTSLPPREILDYIRDMRLEYTNISLVRES